MLGLLLKSKVKEHARTTKEGKVSWVKEYFDKRTKKPEEQAQPRAARPDEEENDFRDETAKLEGKQRGNVRRVDAVGALPVEEWAKDAIIHTNLQDALKKGLIEPDTAAVIDSFMEVFPDSWKQHFGVRVSGQEFKPNQEQADLAGIKEAGDFKTAKRKVEQLQEQIENSTPEQQAALQKKLKAAQALSEKKRVAYEAATKDKRVVSSFSDTKFGADERDARHLAILYHGATAGDFLKEVGRFCHDRMLSETESSLVKKLHKEDVKTKGDPDEEEENVNGEEMDDAGGKGSIERSAWFAEQFQQWMIEKAEKEHGLNGIFTKTAKAAKGVYSRLRGQYKPLDPQMVAIFEDLMPTGTDNRTWNFRGIANQANYFYNAHDMVAQYLVGADALDTFFHDQGISLTKGKKKGDFDAAPRATGKRLGKNSKTFMSYDPSGLCPKSEDFGHYLMQEAWLESGKDPKVMCEKLADADFITKHLDLVNSAKGVYLGSKRIEAPCSYCYVEHGRRKAIALFNAGERRTGVNFAQAKKVFSAKPYKDAILKIKPEKIVELNKRGGLRMFSFSDYIKDAHQAEITKVLQHCEQVGLSVKAITKQTSFVKDFAKTGIGINQSCDFGPTGMDWAEAVKNRKEYPDNVKIRTVAMNLDDFDAISKMRVKHHPDGRVELPLWHTDKVSGKLVVDSNPEEGDYLFDVITPYHHEGKKPPPKGAMELGFGSRGQKELEKRIQENRGLAERVCCQAGGKCYDKGHAAQCSSNCGQGAGKMCIPKMGGGESGDSFKGISILGKAMTTTSLLKSYVSQYLRISKTGKLTTVASHVRRDDANAKFEPGSIKTGADIEEMARWLHEEHGVPLNAKMLQGVAMSKLYNHFHKNLSVGDLKDGVDAYIKRKRKESQTMQKSHVRQYERVTGSGKVAVVKEHNDKRQGHAGMKITSEDYGKIKDGISGALAKRGVNLDDVKKEYADKGHSPTRLAWDLFHSTGMKIGDGKGMPGDVNLYSYLNDDHITTALHRIVGELSGKALAKSHVKAYTRVTKTGKTEVVKEHDDKRQSSGPDPKTNWISMASSLIHNDPDLEAKVKPHREAMKAAITKKHAAPSFAGKLAADKEAQGHAHKLMQTVYEHGKGAVKIEPGGQKKAELDYHIESEGGKHHVIHTSSKKRLATYDNEDAAKKHIRLRAASSLHQDKE